MERWRQKFSRSYSASRFSENRVPSSATRRPAAAFQRRPNTAATPGLSAKKAKPTRRRRRSKAISDSEDDEEEEEEEDDDVDEFDD